MIADVLTLIADWRSRARTALETHDTAGAATVLREAASLDTGALAGAPRDAGRELGALAAELIELPEPALLEAVFQRALAIFQQASDTSIGDLLTTWNNLAALYDRHGAGERRNQVYGVIGGIAERYDGPLDSAAATVFMQIGELYRRHRSFPGMVVAYRQVQRFMIDATDMPDETRAAWLGRFAGGFAEAERDAEVEAAIEEALPRLQAIAPPQPLSLAKCAAILASCRSARRDFRGAAEALEPVFDIPGLPEDERTAALSWAGRSWYKAGEFDSASRCFLRAVRRRAGLAERASSTA